MLVIKRILLLISMLFPITSFAQDTLGAGAVAENLMEPVSMLGTFVGSGSIAIGVACLFASFIKFIQNRANPLQSPISTVILLFVMGIILVLLPLTYKLTSGGVPF